MSFIFDTQPKVEFSKPAKFAPLLFAIVSVFAWVTWTTYWDPGLYGDNVEQFVWVHSLPVFDSYGRNYVDFIDF